MRDTECTTGSQNHAMISHTSHFRRSTPTPPTPPTRSTRRFRPPARSDRRGRRSSAAGWAGVLVWSLLAACTASEAPPVDPLEVDRPADLARLDAAVQQQFEGVWRDVHGGDGLAAEANATAPAWGRLGQWFQVYGYRDSAALCYRNAGRLDPDEPRWSFYLGMLAEEDGDLDAAREHFEAAAALAPEAVEPRVRLGDLALQQRRLEVAERWYGKALSTDPRNPGALLGRARLALQRGDAEAAVRPLQSLVRRQPEAVEVRYTLAMAWRRLGDQERAAEHLQRIPEETLDQRRLAADAPWQQELKLLDVGARNLTRRGVRAARRGEPVRAATLLGRAVAADPDGPEKRINYALALRRLRQWGEARRQLETAVRLCASHPEMTAKAHLELGRLLATLREPAAAVDHLETALHVDPKSVQAHLALGSLLHRQGRLEEALEHFAAARSLDPSQIEARFWHAAVLVRLDRRREAVATLERDLHRLGDVRRLRLLLARLLSAVPEGGPRDVARARRLVAEHEAAPDVLLAETAAMVEAADGRFDAARAWQRAAVDVLAENGPRSAAHTARRRLVLYSSGETCQDPWEALETPIRRPVEAP